MKSVLFPNIKEFLIGAFIGLGSFFVFSNVILGQLTQIFGLELKTAFIVYSIVYFIFPVLVLITWYSLHVKWRHAVSKRKALITTFLFLSIFIAYFLFPVFIWNCQFYIILPLLLLTLVMPIRLWMKYSDQTFTSVLREFYLVYFISLFVVITHLIGNDDRTSKPISDKIFESHQLRSDIADLNQRLTRNKKIVDSYKILVDSIDLRFHKKTVDSLSSIFNGTIIKLAKGGSTETVLTQLTQDVGKLKHYDEFDQGLNRKLTFLELRLTKYLRVEWAKLLTALSLKGVYLLAIILLLSVCLLYNLHLSELERPTTKSDEDNIQKDGEEEPIDINIVRSGISLLFVLIVLMMKPVEEQDVDMNKPFVANLAGIYHTFETNNYYLSSGPGKPECCDQLDIESLIDSTGAINVHIVNIKDLGVVDTSLFAIMMDKRFKKINDSLLEVKGLVVRNHRDAEVLEKIIKARKGSATKLAKESTDSIKESYE